MMRKRKSVGVTRRNPSDDDAMESKIRRAFKSLEEVYREKIENYAAYVLEGYEIPRGADEDDMIEAIDVAVREQTESLITYPQEHWVALVASRFSSVEAALDDMPVDVKGRTIDGGNWPDVVQDVAFAVAYSDIHREVMRMIDKPHGRGVR